MFDAWSIIEQQKSCVKCRKCRFWWQFKDIAGVVDFWWLQAQPPVQHQGNQGLQGDLSANPYFQVRTQIESFNELFQFFQELKLRASMSNHVLMLYLVQHMIENYSNLMYQNMANQRQQGAPPPPGKAAGKKKKIEKILSWNLFRRQARVWEPEGLESRWPWTFLVLAAPPTSYDWLPPHLTFQQIKTTIFFNFVNPTNHILTINPFLLLAPVQLLFVLCLDLDVYPF